MTKKRVTLACAYLVLSLLYLTLSAAFNAASAQGVPKKYLSAASLNPTIVFAKQGFLKGGVVVNTTATVYYLKFYDKATAPTCGTDVPVWTLPLPINSAPVPLQFGAQPLSFVSGIGFCLTAALADNDTTNAATGVAINLSVSGR